MREIRDLKEALRMKKRGITAAPGFDEILGSTVDQLNSQILEKNEILRNLKKQRRDTNRKDYSARSERINKIKNTYLNAGFNFGAFDEDEKDQK